MPRTKPAPAIQPLKRIDDEHFDRWRAARTHNAISVVGYTPVARLYEDFSTWASHEIGPDYVAEEAAFVRALSEAPKPLIKVEFLRVREAFQRPGNANCASLTLAEPVRVAA
ncbi:hypothetical protein [Sphingomonas nostoxanthinifaciens]|uniref:hypothetical protein n=1 Tax=Sphingomonas nostoxanthinifaciens TaxID=2872652 RepID=UPI001CC1E6C1|nr:hypothetical protein [Sphingomonas nostoxanthinifaciens]UAK24208.1 hypothetical protein K8P63_18055 [Sphingomonas nostoxanthinifaciens]